MTPRTIREGGAGSLIRYATAASPLGRMLVAATSTGVCAIAFGSDDMELLADLRSRFDKAQLVPAKGNTGWLADAVTFVASQTTEHPLAATFPLDVRATAFQQRVWKALRQIPRGETRSYSQLARELGGGGRALPPRGGAGWKPHRLSLGGGAQAQAAGGRSSSAACGIAAACTLIRWAAAPPKSPQPSTPARSTRALPGA